MIDKFPRAFFTMWEGKLEALCSEREMIHFCFFDVNSCSQGPSKPSKKSLLGKDWHLRAAEQDASVSAAVWSPF